MPPPTAPSAPPPAQAQPSIPPAETPRSTPRDQTPLGREALNIARYYLGNRWALLALGGGALAIGAGLNWSWLVAAGIAPILIAAAPCALMCALGLCAMKMSGDSK
jgi:hypothetical protein